MAESFDWKAHVRRLAREGGLFPTDVAYDVVDKLVAAGEVPLADEAAMEIAFTEAVNYAERVFEELNV